MIIVTSPLHYCNVLNCSMSCKKLLKLWKVLPLRNFWNLCQNRLLIPHECLGNFSLSKVSYSKLTFLTRNSLFLLETHFSYSKLTFLTRNSLFSLETRFSYSKLTFLTRNSLFLLETRFSYSKLTFLTRNSLFFLETHFSYSKLTFPGNTLFGSCYLTVGIQNLATLATGKFSRS